MLLLLMLIPISPSLGLAQSTTLSETALFHRCYSQLTSLRAKRTDPLLVAVKSGTKTAVNACMEVLEFARLTEASNTKLSGTADSRATDVIATFHRLHSSWFTSKDFPTLSWPGHTGDMRDLYDSTTPALYFTKSLFGVNVPAKYAVTTNDFVRAVRSTPAPTVGPESGHPLADFVFGSGLAFASTGTLQGVETKSALNLSFASVGNTNFVTSPINIHATSGGGILGNSVYLALNFAPVSSYGQYATDGGMRMVRRYGKAVYKDVLCRDLPVVRTGDALDFVNASSGISFRKTAACTKCHVSHDRISGVVRGAFVGYIGQGDPSGNGSQLRGGAFILTRAPSTTAESQWPIAADNNYSRRPPRGQLYFRDYTGALVDKTVEGPSELGTEIANTDDYYVCIAKRYYQYFTGISVNTGDLDDPDQLVTLNEIDKTHRATVVNLGKALKQNQNMTTLVRSILSLDTYRRADFGARGDDGP